MIGEYGRRILRFSLFIGVCLLVFIGSSLAAGCIGLCLSSVPLVSLVHIFECGSWMLIESFPAPLCDDLATEISVYLWPFRAIGLILSALFAGLSVLCLTEPLNNISFSRYVVLNTETKRLRFRYWIREPEKRHLHDVKLELMITTKQELNKGISPIKCLFRLRDPEDREDSAYSEFVAMHGVHYCEIRLSERSSESMGASLFEALKRARSVDDLVMLFRIAGINEGSRVVYAEHRYGINDLLPGYDFLSIRADEIVDAAIKRRHPTYSQEQRRALASKTGNLFCKNLIRRKKKLFHEHFNVVVKLPANEELLAVFSYLSSNKPLDVYQMSTVDCVKRGFRGREFVALAKERFGNCYHHMKSQGRKKA